MQQMLRRTVTVGTQYKLHILTGFLAILCLLQILLLCAGAYNWETFTLIAVLLSVYASLGIVACVYCLWQIQGKLAQVMGDLNHCKTIVKTRLNSLYGKS